MDTYKVKSDWSTFRQFAIDNLSAYKENIGFMHRDNEIIIRSLENKPLDILSQQYKLAPCDQPSNFLNSEDGWAYFGNHNLFELKL